MTSIFTSWFNEGWIVSATTHLLDTLSPLYVHSSLLIQVTVEMGNSPMATICSDNSSRRSFSASFDWWMHCLNSLNYLLPMMIWGILRGGTVLLSAYEALSWHATQSLLSVLLLLWWLLLSMVMDADWVQRGHITCSMSNNSMSVWVWVFFHGSLCCWWLQRKLLDFYCLVHFLNHHIFAQY